MGRQGSLCSVHYPYFIFIAEGQVDMFGSSSIEGWLQLQLANQVLQHLV